MARIAIKEADIARQFEVHSYRGTDGYPAADAFDAVVVTAQDGRQFALPCGQSVHDDEEGFVGYVARYDAAEMLTKVENRMSIDPSYWVELELQESFEERYQPYGTAWQEEQNDRLNGWY